MAARQTYPSDRADKILLRLPEGMRDVIATAARDNKRSMSAEVVKRLEFAFAAEKEIQERTETTAKLMERQRKISDEVLERKQAEMEAERAKERQDLFALLERVAAQLDQLAAKA